MAGEKIRPVSFNCPECGASLEVSALGYTASIVCKNCKSVLDAFHPLYKKIGTFKAATEQYKPFFELGTFGILRGTKWKIIGFLVRRDSEAGFEWEEYLLYNPYKGFKWLLRIDGHFSITSRLFSLPVQVDANQVQVNHFPYKLFNVGEVRVQYVVGEFYWRVKQGEKVTMTDYIAPPYMVSEEISFGAEVTWSISEYVPGKEVLKAFQTANFFFSEPSSVAANQPNPYYDKTKLFWQTLVAVVVLSVVWMSSSLVKSSKTVMATSVVKSGTPFITKSFEVPDKIGNLEVKMSAPVNNSWAEAGITLVNESTGEDFSFIHGVEYYHGYDSDGSWNEGSPTGEKVVSSVPGGTYHMEVEVDGSLDVPATLTLVRNSKMLGNFLAAFFALIIPLLWNLLRSSAFENKRWAESDYASNFNLRPGPRSDLEGSADAISELDF